MVRGIRPVQHNVAPIQLLDRQPRDIRQSKFEFVEPPLILRGARDRAQAGDGCFEDLVEWRICA